MAIRSLTHDELTALLKAARAKRERDWLMILVAYNHGLRVSEVIGIKADDGRVSQDLGCGSLSRGWAGARRSQPNLKT